jgi:hypothetical protein
VWLYTLTVVSRSECPRLSTELMGTTRRLLLV